MYLSLYFRTLFNLSYMFEVIVLLLSTVLCVLFYIVGRKHEEKRQDNLRLKNLHNVSNKTLSQWADLIHLRMKT